VWLGHWQVLPGLGLGTCESIGLLLIALRATWKLREHGWYWGGFAGLGVARSIHSFADCVPVLFPRPGLKFECADLAIQNQ
jgi:hypothetical protein